MTIEKALRLDIEKPWGCIDRGDWGGLSVAHRMVGETWFQRPNVLGAEPELLVKLLYTSQRLSIQVHPDDASAQAMGLPHGKTEAWYVLAAAPGAEVAVGLRRPVTDVEFRACIADGSIETLIQWRPVKVGEFIFVHAGTIHAIGAGLVLAEIQQRSDTTFRLFDYGRGRRLHVESAVAVARAEVAPLQACPLRLSRARTLLLANPYFVIEHLDLAPHSTWQLFAEHETWLLGIAWARGAICRRSMRHFRSVRLVFGPWSPMLAALPIRCCSPKSICTRRRHRSYGGRHSRVRSVRRPQRPTRPVTPDDTTE